MIDFKTEEDGFSLSFNNRLALVHSKRLPIFDYGRSELQIHQRKGSFKIRPKKTRLYHAREWRIIKNEDDIVELDFVGFGRMIVESNEDKLEISFNHVKNEINCFAFRLPGKKDESIFGCGEQYSKLDLKGQKVPLWSEEQGVGRGHDLITLCANLWGGAGGKWYTTYFPQPTFVSSENLYVHMETNAYCLFDFSHKKWHVLRCWEVPTKIICGFKKTATETIGEVSTIVGRQKVLPEWTRNGVWVSAQGGTKEVNDKLEKLLKANVPVGAVWVQDWCGRKVTSFGSQVMWDWSYDEKRSPGLPIEIARLKKEGIRYLGYINPFLTCDGLLFREASEKGYLIKNQDNDDYLVTITTFPAGIVDLWNPDAFLWYKNVIKKNMIGIGMSGWMADFGEYLPTDSRLYDGKDPFKGHNEYPVLWAKLNQEAIQESGKENEIIFFMRSGWSGSSKYSPMFWAGDQLVSWSKDDGLPSVIPSALSLGFSGSGIWHSDIGGYTSVAWIKRNDEVLMRWIEMSAFSPTMRSHESNRPQINSQLWSNETILAQLARMSAVWIAMAPYHNAVMDEYAKTGIPPIRHCYLHYEDQTELRQYAYQYMYGRDLLVAPVLKPGKKLSSAYLPDDEWIHLWTSREFCTGDVTIESPMGYPPVFYRAKSKWASLFEGIRRSAREKI